MVNFCILRHIKPRATTAAILITTLLIVALAQPVALACEGTQPKINVPTPQPGSCEV